MRSTLLASTILALLVGVACSGGASSSSSGSSSGPEVKIALTDFKFTPDKIEIPANTVVKLTAKNSGSVEHDITIDKISYKLAVPTAREVSKNIGPLQPGTYDVYCFVVGHKELGMIATLTVK